MMPPDTCGFRGRLMAGFECASHRPRHRRRLDLTAATAHDVFAAEDYRRARTQGFLTVRDGLRWHLVEPRPGRHDFASVLPMIRASRDAGVQVIWDLCHFGWPDDLDPFSGAFVDRLARLAREFTQLLVDETGDRCYITPINEPSYLSWAAGEVALMHPFAEGRGAELKRNLLQAYVAAIDAIHSVQPGARIVVTDPLIAARPAPQRPDRIDPVARLNEAQFEFRDWLAEAAPDSRYLDIVGACYYKANQWQDCGEVLLNLPIPLRDPARIPLADLLERLAVRYRRPTFLAETSAEGDEREGWARYVVAEIARANARGVGVEGLCWYPSIDHPGWDDDRDCRHGLWAEAGAGGQRQTCWPIVHALRRLEECAISAPASAW